MRRLLLGTTAFVAVGVVGGAAFAQGASEPIKLGLGGYWWGAAGSIIDENVNTPTHGTFFQEDNTVYIKGSTKLDNGLGVGAMIQLRGIAASSSLDTEKRSYVYFTGTFGKVQFGDYEDARFAKAFVAPSAGTIFGVNTPVFNYSNSPAGTNTTTQPLDVKRSQRIGYFTPSIAGFSLAATYTPDSHKGNLEGAAAFNGQSGGGPADNDPGANSEGWAVAAGYDNKFGDFSLSAYAGVAQTQQEAPRAGSDGRVNPRAYDGGLKVGFGPFAVGATVQKVYNARSSLAGSGLGGLDNTTFDVGASYTQGPFQASLGWSRARLVGFSGGSVTGTDGTAINDIYELIGAYTLGPGIELDGMLEYSKYNSGVASTGALVTQNYHAVSIAFGTALAF